MLSKREEENEDIILLLKRLFTEKECSVFAQKNRLRKNEEVLHTIKKGVNFKTSFFNVKFLKTNEDFKITVVVSKKISKKAVERNRIKRILRASIQNFLNKKKDDEKFSLKWKFVFFPFFQCIDKKSTDLDYSVEKAFKNFKFF